MIGYKNSISFAENFFTIFFCNILAFKRLLKGEGMKK